MTTKNKVEKNELTKFGKAAKKRLIDINMKQDELARTVGTTNRYLDHIFHGRRSGEKYIHKIAEVLKIDLTKYIA